MWWLVTIFTTLKITQGIKKQTETHRILGTQWRDDPTSKINFGSVNTEGGSSLVGRRALLN